VTGTLQAANVFGVVASDTTSAYFNPGIGNPAVSTGDYYWVNPYWMRPYDLAAMGTPGASVMAAHGGMRYVWIWTADHPSAGQVWNDEYGTWFAFSNDPGVFPDPSTMYCGIPALAQWTGGTYGGVSAATAGVTSAVSDMLAFLVYNPDDVSFPFYLYSQGHALLVAGGAPNCCALHRSADLVTWTPYGGSHMGDLTPLGANAYSAFQRVTRINSTTWISKGLGPRVNLIGAGDVNLIWTSSDGKSFTPTTAPTNDKSYNTVVPPDTTVAANFSTFNATQILTTSSGNLWTSADVGKQIFILAVNANGILATTIKQLNSASPSNSITLNGPKDEWDNYNPGQANLEAPDLTNQPLQLEWASPPIDVLGTAGTIGNFGTQTQYHLSGAENVTVSGQLYQLSYEWINWFGGFTNRGTQPRYITLVAIDSNFNCLTSPSQIRVAPGATLGAYTANYDNNFPGPRFLQDVNSYQEDGILHIYAKHGFAAQVGTLLPGLPFSGDGGLCQTFIDYYTYIYDSSAAASAAPCGLTATCSRGTVTLTWYNAVSATNYSISRYTSLANLNSNTSPTNLGTTTANTFLDTPGAPAQYWYKVANSNGGKFRFVNVYVGLASAAVGLDSGLVNKHISRVMDDNGGSIPASLDVTHLNRIDSWLTANGLQSNLLYWADARFGVKISAGKVVKVYCLGSTRLPRGHDLSPATTNTTYSATALNSALPGWVNTSNTNYMMWGVNTNDTNLKARFNQIRRKTQITVAALYQRTAASATLFGSATSTSSGVNGIGVPNYDGIGTGMYLQHGTGSPGTITFALRDQTSLKTCTVAASGNANTVAVGTYDGTNMYAFSDGTRGTANATLDPNLQNANDTFLAGSRATDDGNITWPFLCSGSQSSYYSATNGVGDVTGVTPYFPGSSTGRTFSTTDAQFNCGSLAVFDVALTQAQVKSLTILLNGGTVDIKADYGATGDGQIATATITISNLTPTILTSTTSIFNTTPNAEVGKYIAITGAGTAGATLAGGLITASSPLSDGKQVTFTNAASTFPTASVQTVEWGHDDAVAFNNFNLAWQGQTGITLTIPPGRYCFCTTQGLDNTFCAGIRGLTISGDSGSNPILSNLLGVGSLFFLSGELVVIPQDNRTSALTQTVTPGTTVIPLITAANASLFTPFTWALMSGLDTQTGGQPINPEWAEFVFIIAVHTGAGGGDPSTVTIQSPLKYKYESTWPLFDNGSTGHFSYGGPAMLYSMNYPGWDCDFVFNNLVLASPVDGIAVGGRNITFNGGGTTAAGPVPSGQLFMTVNNYTFSSAIEVDKLIDTFTISNSSMQGIEFQSAWPNTMVYSNVTFNSYIHGSAKNTSYNNCTYLGSDIRFGPDGQGSGFSANAVNTTFGTNVPLGQNFGGAHEDDITGVGAYSMSGGVISRVFTAGGYANRATLWAVPGQYCFFSSGSFFGISIFKIIDVTWDGTTIFITTDQTGGFPAPISPATTININTHPAPSLTFSGCSGTDPAAQAWSNAPPGRPLFSYWNYTYLGDIGAGLVGGQSYFIPILGTFVSAKFTVNSGYSAGTFNLGTFSRFLGKPGNAILPWNPSIDLTQPGVRFVTATAPPTGAVGADSGLALPQSNVWWPWGQPQAKMSGAVGSGSITVEFITDQGFNLVPAPVVLASIPFRTSG